MERRKGLERAFSVRPRKWGFEAPRPPAGGKPYHRLPRCPRTGVHRLGMRTWHQAPLFAHALRPLPGRVCGARKSLGNSAENKASKSFAVVFPHSLVLALPPLPPPWGNGSIRRTRCKLNRSRKRGPARPQCPPVPQSAPPFFPLSELVPRATFKCRFVSEAFVSSKAGELPRPPRSPGFLGTNTVSASERGLPTASAPCEPRPLGSSAPRLLGFCPGTPHLHSRILPLISPSFSSTSSLPVCRSLAYTHPESSILKQTSLAPCSSPATVVFCFCFFLSSEQGVKYLCLLAVLCCFFKPLQSGF